MVTCLVPPQFDEVKKKLITFKSHVRVFHVIIRSFMMSVNLILSWYGKSLHIYYFNPYTLLKTTTIKDYNNIVDNKIHCHVHVVLHGCGATELTLFFLTNLFKHAIIGSRTCLKYSPYTSG